MVAKFRAPGMYRAFLFAAYGVALSYALIWVFRPWYSLDPVFTGAPILELALLLAPLGSRVRRAARTPGTSSPRASRTLAAPHSCRRAHH